MKQKPKQKPQVMQLTSHQKDMLFELGDKWLRIGLNTDPIDKREAEDAFTRLYKITKLPAPKFYWYQSPHQAFDNRLDNGNTAYLDLDKVTQTRAYHKISDKTDVMRGRMNTEIGNNFHQSLVWAWRNSIIRQASLTLDGLSRQVAREVINAGVGTWGRPSRMLASSFNTNPGILTRYTGQFGIGNVMEYLIATGLDSKIFRKKFLDHLDVQIAVARSAFWFWPTDGAVYATNRPKEIHLNQANLLHNDHGPAMSFGDGFSLWRLNGVRVSKEIVMTHADQLNPWLIVTERNSSVRREIFRKIGAERVLDTLGATTIDRKTVTYHRQVLTEDGFKITPFQSHYELVVLELEDRQRRPYLKMSNPSVPGEIHIEGVRPDIRTVDQALEFRNGTKELPFILT